MMENNRNFFITIALSVLILTLWQVFYMNPRIEGERELGRGANLVALARPENEDGNLRRPARRRVGRRRAFGRYP